MKNYNKFAIVGLIICFCFIIAGCYLAFNSNAEDKGVSPTYEDPEEETFYPDLLLVSIPEKIPQQIKEYTGFTVSFNKDNHTPNYVSWELLDKEIVNERSRSDKFWQDEEIIGCPSHKDYSYSGYDRGHMCPAADQKWSDEAMNDCFVMSNMCPQDHRLNAGAWNTLENKERQWAKRDGSLIIIAGPIYSEYDSKTIGDIGVRVPSAFFKAFLAPYVEKPRAIAFVYPNMEAPGNMQDYAMSIDQLEEILNYDFFSSLPDNLEEKVEANYSFIEWNNSK
ncbi:MAG: DNA/RNA non-specific endonuclease [Muribaculaceae bacterium]|nr:DNA/RNA non-specific endonuclease [Muribaculaceae bacterium]